MRCIFCKEDSMIHFNEEWVNITDKIEVKLIHTINTEAKLWYYSILFHDSIIGTLAMNGINLYEDNWISLKDEKSFNSVKVKDAIKCIPEEHDGKPFYFRLFMKKKYYESLATNPEIK